jgi:hypothetical protein
VDCFDVDISCFQRRIPSESLNPEGVCDPTQNWGGGTIELVVLARDLDDSPTLRKSSRVRLLLVYRMRIVRKFVSIKGKT